MAIDLESILGGYPKEVRYLDWRTRESVVNEWRSREQQGKGSRGRWLQNILPFVGIWVAMFAVGKGLEIFGLVGALASLFGGCVFFVWMLRLTRRGSRMVLRDVMLERGIRPGRCFQCGYDVTHTPADACPECGDALLSPGTKDGASQN